MNENRTKNADIDSLLTDYFRAAMPDPWPICRAGHTNGQLSRRSRRWLSLGRIAVAASVAVLLAGYLALAGFFPRESAGKLNQDPSRNIGRNPAPAVPAPGIPK